MITLIIAVLSAIVVGWIMFNYGRISERVDAFDATTIPFGLIDKPVRISLNEANFSALIAGQVIEPEPGIFICLKDIGYDLMMDIIMDNQTQSHGAN